MADEIITLYTKEAPDTPISCERTEYYDNDFTTYKDHYPALIDVFLFNRFGDVLLQRRGRDKRKNPYKLHTTVGGHINWGEKQEFALVHECMEELGAPTLLFPSDVYHEAVNKLKEYTRKVALVHEVKVFFRNYSQDEIENRRNIKDRIWLYFGLYDGPVDTPDRASAGYEWIGLDILQKELETRPEQFTSGLAAYFEEMGDEMRNFVKKYSSGKS